jgi:DNA (cytosine-5)-methyltransferase 1
VGPRVGSLCTGAAGLDLAVETATGGTVVWHAESDPRIARILDQHRPHTTNLGDITHVDWADVPPVDVLSAGTPCQDLSVAGNRAGMTEGTRSNLWVVVREAVACLRPALLIWENVHGALSAPAQSALGHCPRCMGDERPVPLRALGRVLGDLADLGYDTRWGCVRASDVGAPHIRSRVFLAAHPAGQPRLHPWLTTPLETARWRPLRVAAGRHRARRLPTPRVTDRRGAAGHGDGGPDLRTAVSYLPTPVARDHKGSDITREGSPSLPALVLPTPAVNDMGRAMTVPQWDAFVARLQDKFGNDGHGASLSIEVRRGFGRYARAVAHWEDLFGPAPDPLQTHRGHQRLNPAFSEWMLGLPAGWVTDVPGVSHVTEHRALGNACSPQQAHLALTLLLTDDPEA